MWTDDISFNRQKLRSAFVDVRERHMDTKHDAANFLATAAATSTERIAATKETALNFKTFSARRVVVVPTRER